MHRFICEDRADAMPHARSTSRVDCDTTAVERVTNARSARRSCATRSMGACTTLVVEGANAASRAIQAVGAITTAVVKRADHGFRAA